MNADDLSAFLSKQTCRVRPYRRTVRARTYGRPAPPLIHSAAQPSIPPLDSMVNSIDPCTQTHSTGSFPSPNAAPRTSVRRSINRPAAGSTVYMTMDKQLAGQHANAAPATHAAKVFSAAFYGVSSLGTSQHQTALACRPSEYRTDASAHTHIHSHHVRQQGRVAHIYNRYVPRPRASQTKPCSNITAGAELPGPRLLRLPQLQVFVARAVRRHERHPPRAQAREPRADHGPVPRGGPEDGPASYYFTPQRPLGPRGDQAPEPPHVHGKWVATKFLYATPRSMHCTSHAPSPPPPQP